MKVFSIILSIILIVGLSVFIIFQTIGLIRQIKEYRKKKKEKIKIFEKKEE